MFYFLGLEYTSPSDGVVPNILDIGVGFSRALSPDIGGPTANSGTASRRSMANETMPSIIASIFIENV